MDGEWYEDTFAGFQPPQPEFFLPTTIACSDTIHLSPNSIFLLKQHNFRISLTISYFNNATFLLLVPSPVLPNITDPNPRHSLQRGSQTRISTELSVNWGCQLHEGRAGPRQPLVTQLS